MTKEKYNKLKAEGICVRCGKAKAIVGKVQCKECADRNAKTLRETRKWCKDNRICPRCMKNKLFGDENTCPECLAKEMIWKKDHPSKKYASGTYEYKLKRFEEDGLCMKCHKVIAVKGKKLCVACAEKHRVHSERYRRNKTGNYMNRSERISYGLCYICGSPLQEGKGTCPRCTEIFTKNVSNRVTPENHIWKRQNSCLVKG